MMKAKTTMIGIGFFPSKLIQSKLWASLSLISLSEIGYTDYTVSLDIIHHFTRFSNFLY